MKEKNKLTIGLILSALTIVVSFTIPEIRSFLGLQSSVEEMNFLENETKNDDSIIQESKQPSYIEIGDELNSNLSIIFEEFFDNNNNGWYIDSGEYQKGTIVGGRYIIEHKRNVKCWLFYKNIKIDTKKNFKISSTMTFLDGVVDNGYGLLWGGLDSKNYYEFIISSNGQFIYEYFLDGKLISESNWVESSKVNQGKRTNKIEIEKKGEKLEFRINDERIFTTTFTSFFGDRIGFSLNRKMSVAIDQIKIWN